MNDVDIRKYSSIRVAVGMALALGSLPAYASDGVKTAGEILRIALPVAAGGFSIYKQDYDGVLQLTVWEVFAEGTSLVLQHFIKEQRPDKSDGHSFPSDSAAVAFSAASYLQIRYGWDYSLPAYAVAAFVGYSRVEAKKHHWGDVLAGAVLGWGASEITTVRYRNFQINAMPGFGETPLGFSVSAN